MLAEIERMVGELQADLKRGSSVPVTSLLKGLHDGARGLRTELDLAVDSPWGRRLAAIRAEISSVLKAEIEFAPGPRAALVAAAAGQRDRARQRARSRATSPIPRR